ncbi:MAG: nucleotidyltransferase domain-containing protein [Kofleriaceae bacterium]
MLDTVLSERELRVVRAYVAAREQERRHLVAYVSGAHAYGFASPDSDVDLKCIHVAATGDLVGLTPTTDGADRIEIIEGVEVDYGSNELAGALRGAIKGNGNYLERFLGELIVTSMPELLAESRPIIARLLSQRVGRHYAGFAAGQLRQFDEKPTAKRALYVLRTSATGRHLLETGELVTDLRQLAARYAPAELPELLEIKLRGEQSALSPEQVERWRARLTAAIAAVDDSVPRSCLPAEPPARAVAEADEWLRSVRRHYW